MTEFYNPPRIVSESNEFSGTDGRGGIRDRPAYERAKLITHAGWSSILPRNITPSDIDAFLDNKGSVILFEYSFCACEWLDPRIPQGQLEAYRSMVLLGTGALTAVIARCDTPVGRPIDSLKDIHYWEAARCKPGTTEIVSETYGLQDSWEMFVREWFTGWYGQVLPPSRSRRR